jgi:hypothetical protein
MVQDKIPVAKIIYYDHSCNLINYPYAILEYVEGTLMRDVIFEGQLSEIGECGFEAGKYLGMLRQFKLPKGGFFQSDMTIRAFSPEEEYLPFVRKIIKENNVVESIGNILLVK